MKFTEFRLRKVVSAGIKAAGFTECTPVQASALPLTLKGNDVMVQSKTGSGKTAVYVLTFLQRYVLGKAKRCLVISPTRELAQQIASDAQILSQGIENFSIGCFFGGVGYEKQEKMLKKDCVFLSATPGRILDFISSGKLDPKSIDTFVIDEADRMFDMGFYPDIVKLFKKMVPCGQRHTMLFSATLEQKVRQMAWEFMNNAQVVELEPDSITVDTITQELYHVSKSEKFHLFLQLLASIKPESALVFTNSRHMTAELAKRLELNGYKVAFISGDLTQTAREKALAKIKNGKIKILVATDVAARGLQIDDLPLVVNYDIPEDYENYVHRIGRTARAGKSGKAITLADEEFVYGLEAIEKYIKTKIPVIWPDNLPEVEDKSLGQSWGFEEKKKPKKTGGGQSKKRVKESAKGQAEGRSKAQIKDISPSKLGQMTEEQRMEYYRKKYGFEPVKKTNTQQNINPVQEIQKKSFFSRLFGKKAKKVQK